MIVAERISKSYGLKPAVQDLSFKLEAGSVLGFIGPNGAGKTTTMRILCGAMPPSSGKIVINGLDMAAQAPEAKASIGYLPENAPLYQNMRVRAFLRFCGRMRGLAGKDLEAKFDLASERCSLGDVLEEDLDSLSKGFRRRVCLAQAIMHNPSVLILDEPTDGLDPVQKRGIRKLIEEMREGRAIIVSTHILEEVDAVCDRVLAISSGRKLFDGATAEFKALAPSRGVLEISISGFGTRDAVLDLLKPLKGLASVSAAMPEGAGLFKLRPSSADASGELLNDALAAIRSAGWRLDSCAVSEGRLDEVFTALIDKAAAPQPEEPAK